MGFRFRKSFKVVSGVRLNLSKGGTSWSIGRRGATLNIGGRGGPRTTVSAPGTGLSYSETARGGGGGGWLLLLFAAIVLIWLFSG